MSETDVNGNSNCLDGIQCPQCGNHEEIKVAATIWVSVFDNGTGGEDGGAVEWDDSSPAQCPACNLSGTFRAFRGVRVSGYLGTRIKATHERNVIFGLDCGTTGSGHHEVIPDGVLETVYLHPAVWTITEEDA